MEREMTEKVELATSGETLNEFLQKAMTEATVKRQHVCDCDECGFGLTTPAPGGEEEDRKLFWTPWAICPDCLATPAFQHHGDEHGDALSLCEKHAEVLCHDLVLARRLDSAAERRLARNHPPRDAVMEEAAIGYYLDLINTGGTYPDPIDPRSYIRGLIGQAFRAGWRAKAAK